MTRREPPHRLHAIEEAFDGCADGPTRTGHCCREAETLQSTACSAGTVQLRTCPTFGLAVGTHVFDTFVSSATAQMTGSVERRYGLTDEDA